MQRRTHQHRNEYTYNWQAPPATTPDSGSVQGAFKRSCWQPLSGGRVSWRGGASRSVGGRVSRRGRESR